jgi:hypothetical protein
MLTYFCLFVVVSLAMLGLRWLVLGDAGPNDEDDRGGWHGWF